MLVILPRALALYACGDEDVKKTEVTIHMKMKCRIVMQK